MINLRASLAIVALLLVWGLSVIGDSAQFSTAMSELAEAFHKVCTSVLLIRALSAGDISAGATGATVSIVNSKGAEVALTSAELLAVTRHL